MWYRKAEDEDPYSLKALNNEVRIDAAAADIMEAMHSGKNLDLSDRGFKGITVKSPVPESEQGIAPYHLPDHLQGLGFECQALIGEFEIIKGTVSVLRDQFYVPDDGLHVLLDRSQVIFKHLNEQAFDALSVAEEHHNAVLHNWKSTRTWDNETTEKWLKYEREKTNELLSQYAFVVHKVFVEMLKYASKIPSGPYLQLWQEYIDGVMPIAAKAVERVRF